jgi:endo-1,4-beta-xylanase
MIKTVTVATLLASFAALSMSTARAAETPNLKQVFAKHFHVGAALGTHQIMGQEPAALELVARQFDSISPENCLKWAEVHPALSEYRWEATDKYVAFGEEHKMFIVGHTLVWHNQTPPEVFADESGQPLSRDALLERMREHIHAVVGRYKGRVHGWDVVNEALEDDGRLRDTPWRKIIGDDYLEQAFQFAHEADPEAELYYNDYNEWHPGKRAAVSQLVKHFQERGVRIDGIGMQGHWGMSYPSPAEIEAMLEEYGALGVKLMVTELDINLLPDPGRNRGADITRNIELRKELDPYAEGLPAEVAAAQAKRYREIFELLVKHADKIDRVTFWGVHDGHSWLNGWPVRGRTSYPLLFDRKYQSKAAFRAVVETPVVD